MSKYKTANTNKYIDKNKSQTIEKQLTPDSNENNYFQKVISPSTPFNSMSKSAIIQKKELPPVVQEIIDYVKSLSENPENKKLIENLLGSANNTISNLGTDALRLVNRGAYHGIDALENVGLYNKTVADNKRFGVLAGTAQEGLPTEALRSNAFEDLKRLYSQKFPDNRWDALNRDPSGESFNFFNDPWFRSKNSTDANHPIIPLRNRYTERRNRLGTGLGLGLGLGAEALINQAYDNKQEDGQKIPYKINFNKSTSKQKSVNKRGSVQKGDYASGLFNDGNESEIHYDGQPMPNKKGSSKIHYDGQPMPSNDELEIQYDGQRKPSEIHYDGQPMPIKNQYDRQEMPSSILSQVMPQIGPNILSQVMPKNGSNILSQIMPRNGSNILSQVMPENWSNIANQYMPEKMIELLSELGLLSNGSNNESMNPTGIRYSFANRRKKLQDAANGEGDDQQIRTPRIRPRNLRQTIPARDIHNGFTGDEYRQLLDHIIPGAGAQYENATASELSELLGNMNDYPSITNAVKGFTLKRAVKKRGSVRKGDYASGMFNGGNGSGVMPASYDDWQNSREFRRKFSEAQADPRTYNVSSNNPQRRKGFGFPSGPTTNYPGFPDLVGYNPAENAVRQSMPTPYDISEYTQGNTNEELMNALKEYAGKTFNNTKPFLDATLFNGDAWNNNVTKPLTNNFYSGMIDPLDAWLRSQNPSKPQRINDPENTSLGKRMSKRMNKKMDEDMAVTPRKVSTNRSIKSSNKYFK